MSEQSNSSPKVLVIGELNMDLILDDVESFPELGKEKLAADFGLTLGSSSAIFASNIARLGTSTSFCGMIGQDDFGDAVLKNLENFEVDTSFIVISPHHKTGLTVIIRQNNDRAMVTYPGAMEHFGPSHFADHVFDEAQHLHISSIFMQPEIKQNLAQIINKARSRGMTISLDTQWDPDEKWNLDLKNLIPKLNFFLPNEAEFLNLSGSETIEQGINKIQPHLTDGTVVIKRGRKGATFFTANMTQTIHGYSNNKPADAIGAGDSFNAGLIHQFLKGKKIEECIRFGNIAGAVSTTETGGTKAIQSFNHVHNIALNKLSITDINDFTE